MSGWAEWLLDHGQADAASIAQATRVLEAAALRPGDTVLDLGAGHGLLTLAAHERIGDAWVLAVDPSVGALEELLRAAHEMGANGIMYLVGDAEVLPLPDASVDVVVMRSVLVHVRDTGAVARELARVLRGGVVALWQEVTAHDPLMQLDADALAVELGDAGFADVAAAVEDPGEEWLVTEESVDARLDAVGAPGQLSLRQRWQEAFAPAETEALVGHLKSLAGGTIRFRRPELFLSARRA